MTSELSHQFSFLVTELKEYNHPEILEEFKIVFPEWEWNGENGGFSKEITFQTATERLYNWLNSTGTATISLLNNKYATEVRAKFVSNYVHYQSQNRQTSPKYIC